jgi:hypothetical protein
MVRLLYSTICSWSYYALKAANEYTTEQIERKSLMLPGVQVPVTARWSGQLLRDTGFGHGGASGAGAISPDGSG